MSDLQPFESLPFHGGELLLSPLRSASFKLMPTCVSICLTDRQTGKIDYYETNYAEVARTVCEKWIETGVKPEDAIKPN